MHELTKRIQQDLEDAPSVLRELREQRDRLTEEIKRIERFVNAFGQPTRSRRPSKKVTVKTPVRRRPPAQTHEYRRLVAQAILACDDEEFTLHQIHDALDTKIHVMATTRAFRAMRESQFIGKMGVNDKAQQLWRIVDTEAAEQYITTTEA
jgi:hypothetical protein